MNSETTSMNPESDLPDNEHAAWDRMPGEGDRWYARFEKFRLAGPSRSVHAVYNDERESDGKARKSKIGDSVPRAWSDAVTKWQWRERAAAWDEARQELTRHEEAEAYRKMREQHLALVSTALGKCKERIDAMLPGELRPRDLITWIDTLTKIERLYRALGGDSPEEQGGVLSIEVVAPLLPGGQAKPAQP